MATLFALLYPDQSTGDKAVERVKGLEQAGFLTVMDSAYVTKSNDGEIKHHGEAHPVRSGAVKGLVLGAMTGIIFSIPVVGIAGGTLAGLAMGRKGAHSEAKEFPDFAKSVSEALEPGGSAIMLLADSTSPERVRHELSPLGGRVMSTELSEERIAEIQAQIDQASAS